MRRRGGFRQWMLNGLAVLQSLAVHVAIALATIFGLSWSDSRPISRPPVINATIVDVSQINAAREQRKQQELNQARQQAAERRRREQAAQQQRDADRRREQERVAAANREQQRQTEQARAQQAEADRLRREREALANQRRERDRMAEERRQAAELARMEAEERALLDQMLAAEEAERAAAANASKRQLWEGQVREILMSSWVKPSDIASNMACLVNIQLVPGGDVIAQSFDSCSVAANTRRSIEDAIKRASPLPWEPGVSPRRFSFRFCQGTACEGQ